MKQSIQLKINHIPFLKIENPPNIYDLKRVKEAARKRTKVETFIRWDVEKVERQKLLNSYSSFETLYISLGELEKKADPKENNLIGISLPGLTDLYSNKEKVKKYAGAPQFAYGGYYYTDKLFLIEDIFEWSHSRISWSEIRTAASIIEELRKQLVKTT